MQAQTQHMQTQIQVRVQTERFDANQLDAALYVDQQVGAVASFIGRVRDHGDQPDVVGLVLEHYAGMTEKVLERYCVQASQRWPLHAIILIHRVGELALGEPIVGVAVASAHRQAAFDAVQFLMDFLKHDAPFWKREVLASGRAEWVEQKSSDQQQLGRWSVSSD
ncbi:MAG: molybdenum cofactor biosynthesis protein MoaE [Moraxellaceae bacterium]